MKVSKWKIHSYITILLIIANSPLMWKCFVEIPDVIVKSLLLLWCVFGIVFLAKFRANNKLLKVVGAIAAYLGVYVVGSGYDLLGSILNLVITSIVFLMYSYMMIRRNHFGDIMEAFVNVFVLLGCVSLFFWLFGSAIDILPFAKVTNYSWGNEILPTKTYFYLYFENAIQNQNLLGVTIPRNCGIFPEAPGYSEFLLIALGIAWFGIEKCKKWKIAVLILSLLSTQSTKAIVVLVVVYIAKFMIDNRGVKTRGIKMLKAFFSIVLVGIGAAVVYIVLLDKSGTASYIVRMDDLNASIKTWKMNKIFGSGYENDLSIIENTTTPWLRRNNGLSMGVGVLLAEGGIVLTLYYVFAFIVGIKSKVLYDHRIELLLFSLLIFLNLFVSNSAFSMSTIFIISSAYAAYACNACYTAKGR